MKWIKASDCEQGACVEVCLDGELIAVRNSKIPGEIIWFTKDEWEAFVAGAKVGDFSL